MKRKLALGLMLTTILSMNTVGIFANESVELENRNVFSIIQPRFTLMANPTSQLTISSTGKATIKGTVYGVSGVTKIATVATLQQYSNGKWAGVKNFSNSSSLSNLSFTDTYTVTKGYNYRVKLTATAYKDATSETATIYSNEIKY